MFNHLPDAVLCAIFDNVGCTRTVVQCASVCRTWQRVIEEEYTFDNNKLFVTHDYWSSLCEWLIKHPHARFGSVFVLGYDQMTFPCVLDDILNSAVIFQTSKLYVYNTRRVSVKKILPKFPSVKQLKFSKCSLLLENDLDPPHPLHIVVQDCVMKDSFKSFNITCIVV